MNDALLELSQKITRMKLTLEQCSDEIDWYISKDRELVPRMEAACAQLRELSQMAQRLAQQ